MSGGPYVLTSGSPDISKHTIIQHILVTISFFPLVSF